MAYMIDPIADAYGISSMHLSLAVIVGYCILLNLMPCDIGIKPFLDCSKRVGLCQFKNPDFVLPALLDLYL